MAQHRVPLLKVVALTSAWLSAVSFDYTRFANAQETAPYAWTLTEARARAETGQADGQYQLGERYVEGRGVPRDRTLALAWFNLAAAGGKAKARPGQPKSGTSLRKR